MKFCTGEFHKHLLSHLNFNLNRTHLSTTLCTGVYLAIYLVGRKMFLADVLEREMKHTFYVRIS
jgi:hypothetical protein